MRPALYALLTVLASLALAAPATAAPTLAEAQAIAYAAFPGHCGPELTIEWDAPMLATHGWEGAATIGDPNCTIRLVSAQRDTTRGCDVLVHERGHVAGHAHTQTGVMAPNVEPWPACNPPAAAVTRTVSGANRSRAQIARSIRYKQRVAKIRAKRAARPHTAASQTPAQ